MSALVYDHGSTDGKVSPALFAVKQFAPTMRAAHIEARRAPYTEKRAPARPQARVRALPHAEGPHRPDELPLR